jgi:hypothetical protein
VLVEISPETRVSRRRDPTISILRNNSSRVSEAEEELNKIE